MVSEKKEREASGRRKGKRSLSYQINSSLAETGMHVLNIFTEVYPPVTLQKPCK